MRTSDTNSTFNKEVADMEVKEMRKRREGVHSPGVETFRRTGRLDKNVDVFGKRRFSRNAMMRDGDRAVLVNGIKLPVVSACDGTGSMGGNLEIAFLAMERFHAMMQGVKQYQPDLAFAVMQDVADTHPVFQMTQWESTEVILEQIRQLVPDKNGGDPTEDYDLGLWYLLHCVKMDIVRYGLKGYLFLVADQIGRGQVERADVERHLGFPMQANSTSTSDICRGLNGLFHQFYIQVGSGDGGSRNEATTWWQKRMGRDRVVIVPEPMLLAEVQAAIVYATETAEPTLEGAKQFLLADGTNTAISLRDVTSVWRWITEANIPFGAQVKLPGYAEVPKPGAVFEHYRHAWPSGHPRSSENVTPADGEDAIVPSSTATSDKGTEPINWYKF